MPVGVEEQKRSVPFQLLLLLERVQDSRQKAVRPTELVYCLRKHNVPGKTAPQHRLLAWCSSGWAQETEGGERERESERKES